MQQRELLTFHLSRASAGWEAGERLSVRPYNVLVVYSGSIAAEQNHK